MRILLECILIMLKVYIQFIIVISISLFVCNNAFGFMSEKPKKSKTTCKERKQYEETLAKIKETSPARQIGRPKNWPDEDQLAWLSVFSTETASDRLNDKKRWKIFSERLLEEWELEKSSDDCKNQVSKLLLVKLYER